MTRHHGVPARPSQTKIIATVGPASRDESMLEKLILAGVDVFRLNMAHGDLAEHEETLVRVRRASRSVGRPVATLVDLAGPKIRLGELPGGQLECHQGEFLQFVRSSDGSAAEAVTTSYPQLIDELEIGDRIVLADGTVILTVESRTADAAMCRVVQGGRIRSRQGVNLPGVKLSLSAITGEDCERAEWAARNGIDFVGLSFVRRADEVRQLQELIRRHDGHAHVVAKIEKPEAVENLDAIVQTADAVMVARGDLGVEIDIAQMAVVQKRILDACFRFQKPAIIATQMLDSMQYHRIPTRAEVTDVANAIRDGADACMLSGETAIGRYPLETVETMHRIALATEPFYGGKTADLAETAERSCVHPITRAITSAAGTLAAQLQADMIVVATTSGNTALCLSKQRHIVPTVGVTDSEIVLRRMCLSWGIIPLLAKGAHDPRSLLERVEQWGREEGILESGHRMVLVAETEPHAPPHNMIVVHEVP